MSDIKAKLDRIRERFSDPAFLANKGLSNEVGIHVFCYDPADELIVREFTARLKSESGTPYHIRECDLYEIFLRLLEDKRGLKSVAGLEEKRGRDYLLLSYIKSARKSRDYDQQLGYQLAKLHQADTTAFTRGHRFGFTADNYAGSTRQHNRPSDSWIDFFRSERLQPLFKLCWSYFSSDEKRLAEQLLAHLEDRLIEPDFPSLLHGNLWCGNVMTGPAGEPIFIDPAVSVGHREVDLAMTELFGGFSGDFYQAYREPCPMDPGYPERRDLYNLYPLLNHLHLFGSAYHHAVIRILHRYA